jgi:hypothetical protein
MSGTTVVGRRELRPRPTIFMRIADKVVVV